MNEQNKNVKDEASVDAEIAAMKQSFKQGRFTLDFEEMDTMSIKRRAEYVRLTLHSEREKLPENKGRSSSEIALESDKEDFYPNVEALCEKMTGSANARFDRAEKAYKDATAAFKGNFTKKQAGARRAINEKYEASVKKMLAEERKKIDAQKKDMEKYLKLAPDSSYVGLIKNILKSNEECYNLAAQYLTAQAAVEKYGFYQKRGVATAEDKKISLLAEEMEESARLKLTNAKEKAYLTLERDSVLRFDNMELMKQARSRYASCAKDTLAFISVPQELTEKALQQGLWATEMKYYDKLIEKRNLTGFHPFKKMALNREIKQLEEMYNKGRALSGDSKYPALTTLEKWQQSNGGISLEKIEEEPIEKEVQQPKQLDLGEQIHAKKEVKEELFQEEAFIEEKIIEEPEMEL